MTDRFGALWIDNFSLDAQRTWAFVLAEKTDAEIRMGLRRIDKEWESNFPPSAPMFRTMCHITFLDLGLNNIDESHDRAVTGQGNKVENEALRLSQEHGHPFRFYFLQLRKMYLDKLMERKPDNLRPEPPKQVERQEPTEEQKQEVSKMLKQALGGS